MTLKFIFTTAIRRITVRTTERAGDMGNNHCSPWTEELRSRVTTLWADHSARQIVKVLMEEFGASFTRNSIVGILKRMGLSAEHKSEEHKQTRNHGHRKPRVRTPKQTRSGEHHVVTRIVRGNSNHMRVIATRESADQYKLRCVEIIPRGLTIIELEPGDCRYPYGGDATSEAITFCGHPIHEGSFCAPHYRLCWLPPQPRRDVAMRRNAA